jgi:hypothetical protein
LTSKKKDGVAGAPVPASPREKLVAEVYATHTVTLERSGVTVEIQELLLGAHSLRAALAMGISPEDAAGPDLDQGTMLMGMIDAFTGSETALTELALWQTKDQTREQIRALPYGDKLQLLEACLSCIRVADVQRFFRLATRMAEMCGTVSPPTASSPT